MKAIFFEQHGEIDVLRYADLPDPKPRPGEALVRVRAVALNHLDIWVRRGWQGLNIAMPHISGSDIAGEIVSVNAESVWSPGAQVIVNPGVLTSEDEWTRRGADSLSPGYKIIGEQLQGGLAELVTVPIQNVFKMPEGRTFEEAAAPLLVATTIWRMLFKRAALTAGESILIVGSGGGVNSLTIPFARAAGATIYVLGSSKQKLERAQKLGADEVINYLEHPNWHLEILRLTRGRGVDVVIDNVGAATLANSMRAAARGGRIVTVGNTSGFQVNLDNRLIFTKQLSLIGSTMGSRQDFIDSLQFMLKHNIKTPIDKIAPLSEGIKMLQHLEEGKQFGKIVLKPD